MKPRRTSKPARPQAPLAPPPSADTRHGVRRPAIIAVAIVTLVASAGAAWWWRAGRAPEPVAAQGAGHVAALPDHRGMGGQQMLDSVRVHFEARDWVGGLAWSHAMNVAFPGTSNLLLNEALAWHNYARGGVERWEGRWDARSSLDRMEFEKRAFALLDSAYAVATSDAERANIDRWRGNQYELIGSPLDAMQAYDASLKKVPGNPNVLPRVSWLQRLLIRPGDPKSVTAKDSAPLPR
ncbi:MAG: hypothetical protein U0704_04410 [Candidatus Eisenbacteria bacterium]